MSYKGVCSDEIITEHFGDLIVTELKDMADKAMNCQRALWYNSEGAVKPGVMALRGQDLDRRQAANAAKEAAAGKRKEAAVIKAAQTTVAIEAAAVEPIRNPDFAVFCFAECSVIAHTAQVGGVDEKWRGFTTCDKMFCPKLKCTKKRVIHQKHCLAISVMRRLV